jgi:hypothetical protein
MTAHEPDPVRRFLRERGCPDEVVDGGLAGLAADWERIAGEIESGYAFGLDDYLNDLDTRQLIEEAMELAPDAERDRERGVVLGADERVRRCVSPTGECLWGERVAEAEGWTPEQNWWYFSLPRAPGPLLRLELGKD